MARWHWRIAFDSTRVWNDVRYESFTATGNAEIVGKGE